LSFDDSKREGGEPTMARTKACRHPSTRQSTTQAPPAALLPVLYRELNRIGPSIAFASIGTLREQVDDSIFEQRMLAAIGGFFGTLALVLAAVGLYGLVAYGTARRTGEIGIRIALGARRTQVLWMILRDSLAMVGAGLALGLPVALAAARAVDSVLFGIQPADPLTFVSTAAILAVIGLAAAFLPAHRAARLEPSQVLRHD
jgi:ABC-type antimicrobial peptide transport system permease subunit